MCEPTHVSRLALLLLTARESEKHVRTFMSVTCHAYRNTKHKRTHGQTRTHTSPDTNAHTPGAQILLDCTPGGTHPRCTNIAPLCSFGAQISSLFALTSTVQQYLCSREHSPAVFVLPGAQLSIFGAPGSTIKHMCSRVHNPPIFVLPGA